MRSRTPTPSNRMHLKATRRGPMTLETRRYYRMGDLSILLRSDTIDPPDVVDEILQHHSFARSDGSAGHDEITVELYSDERTIDIPGAAEEVAMHASGLRILCLDDRLFLRRGDASAEIDLSHSSVQAVVPLQHDTVGSLRATDLYLMLTFSLICLLQHRGRYALHAAALEYRAGEGVLIAGESDSGKSTMTMHLIGEGWRYLSDDSVLLSVTNGTVHACALRRDFALDPDAAELFPEIRRHSRPLLTDPLKIQLSPDQLFPNRRAERCTPRVVIFPELAGTGPSRLRHLSARDAFLRIMQQASFLTRDPEKAASQADVLRRLVGQIRPYLLYAGRDIKEDGRRLSDLLLTTLN